MMISRRSSGTGAQTTWSGIPEEVRPRTRQLGYGLSSGYSSMIPPVSRARKTSSTWMTPRGSVSISFRAWSVKRQPPRHRLISSYSTGPSCPRGYAGINRVSVQVRHLAYRRAMLAILAQSRDSSAGFSPPFFSRQEGLTESRARLGQRKENERAPTKQPPRRAAGVAGGETPVEGQAFGVGSPARARSTFSGVTGISRKRAPAAG